MLLVIVVASYSMLQPYLSRQFGWSLPSVATSRSPAASSGEMAVGGDAILQAFETRRSGVMVQCDLEIAKLLRDDTEGDRHQKMILRIPNTNHTVLLAHNIDLAPRVPAQQGELVTVQGEFEYSDKGGVIHWTHHDPRGKHTPGWIEYQGKRYE